MIRPLPYLKNISVSGDVLHEFVKQFVLRYGKTVTVSWVYEYRWQSCGINWKRFHRILPVIEKVLMKKDWFYVYKLQTIVIWVYERWTSVYSFPLLHLFLELNVEFPINPIKWFLSVFYLLRKPTWTWTWVCDEDGNQLREYQISLQLVGDEDNEFRPPFIPF